MTSPTARIESASRQPSFLLAPAAAAPLLLVPDLMPVATAVALLALLLFLLILRGPGLPVTALNLPLALYLTFSAIAFLASPLFHGKTLTERMMGQVVAMPSHAWRQLNLAWALFFITMGLLNLYVAFNFSEDAWVNFKLFGMMGLTFLFVLAQGFFLARYMEETNQPLPQPSADDKG